MAATFPPSTMKAWQYSSTKGGLDKNLKINPSAALPTPKPNQSLVQVIATALNPVDFKPAEIPIFGRWLVPKPATPGIDFAGCIVTPAIGSSFKRGQLVFGMSGSSPFAGGALSEFTLAGINSTAPLPEGVEPINAATIGVAGLTAYQSIVPNVKKGDRIFINGGSGGTGVFGIQIAKAAGCHVTTSCSTANVEFCKRLGADMVVDYKQETVVDALISCENKFDHVVDNVGSDPDLYWRCHEYTKPDAQFVMVGGTPSIAFAVDSVKRIFWPTSLGGGQRKFVGFFPKTRAEDLLQIVTWMKEGKVTPVIDEKFSFEQAPKAFEKLKTGRAKGKIVIDVALKTYRTGSE